MGKAYVDSLDEVTGSEIAQREGIKLLVVPTVSNIEDTYTLSAQIIDPNTMIALKTEATFAEGKGQILDALGDLAKKIRKDLGESAFSIASRNVGLPHATTTSLEALKYCAEGDNAWRLRKFFNLGDAFLDNVQRDFHFLLGNGQGRCQRYNVSHG